MVGATGALQVGDNQWNERVHEFIDLFQGKQNRHNAVHVQRLKQMMSDRQTRFILDLSDVEKFSTEMVDNLLKSPADYIPCLEEALNQCVSHYDPSYHERVCEGKQIRIGLAGAFGRHHVSVRGLNGPLVNKSVCVQGIVTKMNEVVPKLTVSVHYCPATKEVYSRQHRDATSLLTQKPAAGAIPTEDEEGNTIETDIGLCQYRDSQKFILQELPEKTPTGQMPRHCDVIIEGDLVNTIKPGDRVEVFGVYRPMPKPAEASTTGVFPTRIIGNNVRQCNSASEERIWTGEDIKKFKEIANRDDTLDILGRSFASNIWGHNWVKKGLILMHTGGVMKKLGNGTRLRGDSNVLLIGDPSCGKSQLLRFCMNLSPNAVSTTGRGSSGVGLTAAVTTDSFTKERRLEAGAMVLADGGVVCIDEFDKMNVNDRTAIHEVMEQQTVTIAKAGIHTTLNARCSVVAAANPVEGTWNDQESLGKNINLPDSLLSRFDLVFIIRDTTTAEMDRQIATQVLKSVRYRGKNEGNQRRGWSQKVHSAVIEPEAQVENTDGGEMFQKQSANLYSGDGETVQEFLTIDFLKKYLKYVKENYEPVLTKEAVSALSKNYVRMRTMAASAEHKEGNLVITTRMLESMIRLATAHAKLKCQKHVTVEDVVLARKIIAASREIEDIGSDDEDEEMQDVENVAPQNVQESQKRPREDAMEVDEPKKARVEETREQRLLHIMNAMQDAEGEAILTTDTLTEFCTAKYAADKFESEEIMHVLQQLEDEGKVVVNEDVIFTV